MPSDSKIEHSEYRSATENQNFPIVILTNQFWNKQFSIRHHTSYSFHKHFVVAISL